jgi:hypothetical protein
VALRDLGQLRERRQLGEADEPEVRLVHAQEHRGLGPDRLLVVRGSRAVRRPDLDEARTRACEHFGDPEAVADLDQLAARDDHVAALRERGQGYEHRSRVVVHDERSFGPGEPAQDPSDMILPRAACPGAQVVLEVRVAAADLADALESRLGQRSAAEVRVHDDTGRVQCAAQPRAASRRELLLKAFLQIPGICPCLYVLARAREDRASRLDRERLAAPPRQLVHRGQVAQPHCASAFSAATSVRSS